LPIITGFGAREEHVLAVELNVSWETFYLLMKTLSALEQNQAKYCIYSTRRRYYFSIAYYALFIATPINAPRPNPVVSALSISMNSSICR
jgi:hypothetical protein